MIRFLKQQPLVAATAAAVSVTTCSLLAPPSAAALDFSFSFQGVEGIIRGLVNNSTTNPTDILVSTSSQIGGVGTYAYKVGTGFTVASGAITAADWQGVHANSVSEFTLSFKLPSGSPEGSLVRRVVDDGGVPGSQADVVFGPVETAIVVPGSPDRAAVPGPLPLLGVAAAFGYSRKLRKLVKEGRNGLKIAPQRLIKT